VWRFTTMGPRRLAVEAATGSATVTITSNRASSADFSSSRPAVSSSISGA
jgi:hypothetical protein